MERLTPADRDTKYGPVAQLFIAACKAHGEIYKANGKNREKAGTVSETEIQALVTAAQTADEAIRQATASYTQDDVRLMAAYIEQAVVRVALTPDENGRLTFDVGAARGMVNAIQSLRHLPSVGEPFVNYHLERTKRFVEVCEATGYVPKYGMNTVSVRHNLERLHNVIDTVRKNHEAAKAAGRLLESGTLVAELGRLNRLGVLVSGLFDRWLTERQPATEMGAALQKAQTAAQTATAPAEETPAEPPARRPQRARARR